MHKIRHIYMYMDYYKILEIPEFSGSIRIKENYKRLAMKWHPDRNSAVGAKDRFIEIQLAYDFLSDETRRSRYNETLRNNSEKIRSSENYHEHEPEWYESSKARAEEYSQMPYQDFLEKSLKNVIFHAGFTFQLLPVIFTGSCLFGMSILTIHLGLEDNNLSGAIGGLVILALVFGLPFIATIKRASAFYKSEKP